MLFTKTINFIVFLQIVTSTLGNSVFEWRKSDIYFLSDNNRLDGHAFFEQSNVHSLMQCGMKCHHHPECQSYNYNHAQRYCELNSGSDQSHPSSVMQVQGFNYVRKGSFDIDKKALGPCLDNPCGSDGKCLEQQSKKGNLTFICHCKDGWAGTFCDQPVVTSSWSDWSEWDSCSVTCEEGWQKRERGCYNKISGDAVNSMFCLGRSQEERQCPGLLPCPRWSVWSAWSKCSTTFTCGPGDMPRERECRYGGQVGVDRHCMGSTSETTPCEMPSCEAPVKLHGGSDTAEGYLQIYNDLTGTWGAVCKDSSWKKTNSDLVCKTMGYLDGAYVDGNSSSHVYEIIDEPFYIGNVSCEGGEASLQSCQHQEWEDNMDCSSNVPIQCIVPGGWNDWSSWGECSVTCEEGQRLRTRVCDYPKPARGGAVCEGNDKEYKICVMVACPVDGSWFEWSIWQTCNVTCGGGHQIRERQCNAPAHGGNDCGGESIEIQSCNTHNCPIDCIWEQWSGWDTCNLSCGGGRQARARDMDGPYYGGLDCEGNMTEETDCNTHECPVDCTWSDWGNWTNCNLTCGGGQQMRPRFEIGPYHGGQPCNGSDEDWRDCNAHFCPIDCMLDTWSGWQPCNRSCGGGWQVRNRTSYGPFYGGEPCDEDQLYDPQECNKQECPSDCLWNTWAYWADCNTTCGGGWQIRHRSKEGPQHNGADCVGSPEDSQRCNTFPCPINGEWSVWNAWATCSETCGNGTQIRSRSCVEPLYGGSYCEGEQTQEKSCIVKSCAVDGVWSTWGIWSGCSVTCSNGTSYRTRLCAERLHGGKDCEGNLRETESCNMRPCPVDGFWKEWSMWAECTEPCGGGTSARNRDCEEPKYGGENCTGTAVEHMLCNMHNCPLDGFWIEWEEWQSCNVTCGGGLKRRTRQCEQPKFAGKNCTGEYEDFQICNNISCPVDCYWLEWTEWSTCNRSCGTGYQNRQRKSVGPEHNGTNCKGENLDWKICNTETCAINCVWFDWQPWDPCNVTCGGGTMIRTRAWDGPFDGGQPCNGSAKHQEPCNSQPCPVNCTWTTWSRWSTCNTTCGGGRATRRRISVGPFYEGKPCSGDRSDWKDCNSKHCPIDCYWETWQSWGVCNVTCGGGEQQRVRSSVGPYYDGIQCNGSSEDRRDCNTHRCPINCEWKSWTEWSSCNMSCGGGSQERSRLIIGPQHGGLSCKGSAQENRECNTHVCAIDCVWSTWSVWDTCNVTCGGGIKARYRTPIGPFHGGQNCTDEDVSWTRCNTRFCPIDCVWNSWQEWQACSVSCGGGEQHRSRIFTAQRFGGQDCYGLLEDYQQCNAHNCPVDGYWNEWSEWTFCNATCGGGIQMRNRTCEPPFYGGNECEGPDNETSNCNNQACPIPGEWQSWSSWDTCSVTCQGGTRMRSRDCNMTSYGDLTIACIGNNTEVGSCHEYDCLPYAKTCSEYIERGFVDDGWVEIEPAGGFGSQPFFVSCNNTGPNRGETVVHHQYNHPQPVKGFEGAGEFQAYVNYQDFKATVIPIDMIRNLVDSSEQCRQYIRWDCLSAAFNPDTSQLKEENKQPYKLTYWLNRWEEMMDYWGNATSGINKPKITCGCGVEHACYNPSLLCNCDANDDVWRYDEGYLTAKYDLPVTAVHAGDTGIFGVEEGKFTLGPLICSGVSDSSYGDSYWNFG